MRLEKAAGLWTGERVIHVIDLHDHRRPLCGGPAGPWAVAPAGWSYDQLAVSCPGCRTAVAHWVTGQHALAPRGLPT